jgi:hypothetical protein
VVTLLLGALIGVLIGLVIGQEPEIRSMLDAESTHTAGSSGVSGGVGSAPPIANQSPDASQVPSAPSEPARPKRGAEQLRAMDSLNKAMVRIAELPSFSVAPPPLAPAAPASDTTATDSDSGLLAFVNHLFQVRRTDQAAHAFYSTEVYQVSREQIRLRLLSARISVQLDDIPMAIEDVIAARQQMARIFDRQIPDVDSVLRDLNRIEADLRRLL